MNIKPIILEKKELCFSAIDLAYRNGCVGSNEPYAITAHTTIIDKMLHSLDPRWLTDLAAYYGKTIEDYKIDVIAGKMPIRFRGAFIVANNDEGHKHEIRFHSFAKDRELIILPIES